MRQEHLDALATADPVTRVLLRRVVRAGWGQADHVLALLRINTRDSLRVAELLVGRPITVCPPCLRGSRFQPPVAPRLGDERLVTSVSVDRGPRCVLSSDLYVRLSVARVGMSVLQLRARGVRQRDILIATRRGYLTVEARS